MDLHSRKLWTPGCDDLEMARRHPIESEQLTGRSVREGELTPDSLKARDNSG